MFASISKRIPVAFYFLVGMGTVFVIPRRKFVRLVDWYNTSFEDDSQVTIKVTTDELRG